MAREMPAGPDRHPDEQGDEQRGAGHRERRGPARTRGQDAASRSRRAGGGLPVAGLWPGGDFTVGRASAGAGQRLPALTGFDCAR